jgi:hypothetical protein
LSIPGGAFYQQIVRVWLYGPIRVPSTIIEASGGTVGEVPTGASRPGDGWPIAAAHLPPICALPFARL